MERTAEIFREDGFFQPLSNYTVDEYLGKDWWIGEVRSPSESCLVRSYEFSISMDKDWLSWAKQFCYLHLRVLLLLTTIWSFSVVFHSDDVMSLAVQHFKWNVAQVADLEPPAVARMYPHRSDDYLPEAFLCSGKKSVE